MTSSKKKRVNDEMNMETSNNKKQKKNKDIFEFDQENPAIRINNLLHKYDTNTVIKWCIMDHTIKLGRECDINSKDPIDALRRNKTTSMSCLPDELKRDQDVVLECLKIFNNDWNFSDSLFKSPYFVNSFIDIGGNDMSWFLLTPYGDNADMCLKVLSKDGMMLKHLKYHSSKPHVIAAVKQNGMALLFADRNLRDDVEIINEATKQNPRAVRYIYSDDIMPVSFYMDLIKKDGLIIKYVPPYVKAMFSIRLESVSQNGMASEFMGVSNTERDIAIAAVENNPMALKHLVNFEDDKEVVMIAINNNSDAAEFMSEKLKKDMKMIEHCLRIDGESIKYFYEVASNDKRLVEIGIENNSKTMYYARMNLRRDKQWILKLIQYHPDMFQYICEGLYDDEDFIINALKLNKNIITFIKKYYVDNGRTPKNKTLELSLTGKTNIILEDVTLSKDIQFCWK